MGERLTPEHRARLGREMTDWQKIRYGDTDAARAALAYYRERGWRVDDPHFTRDTELIEDRIYAFTSGYDAALAPPLDPETCRRSGHGPVVCTRCGAAYVPVGAETEGR